RDTTLMTDDVETISAAANSAVGFYAARSTPTKCGPLDVEAQRARGHRLSQEPETAALARRSKLRVAAIRRRIETGLTIDRWHATAGPSRAELGRGTRCPRCPQGG